MPGHIYLARGDIAQLGVDAVVYSASNQLNTDGYLCPPFTAHHPNFRAVYDALPRPQQLGWTHWIPLSEEHRPYGVVVVVVFDRTPLRPELEATLARFQPWLAEEIEQTLVSDSPLLAERRERIPFFLQRAALSVWCSVECAVSALRQLPRTRTQEPLLIALPTIGHGRGGNRRFPLPSARVLLRAAQTTLQNFTGVDIAFVPYTLPSYQVLRQARWELRTILEPETHFPEELDTGFGPRAELVQRLRDQLCQRRCILFFGSGLSTAAGLPSWDRLNERFAKELGLLEDVKARAEFDRRRTDLDYSLDLAQWYAGEFGEARLHDLVSRTYRNSTPGQPTIWPTLAHYLLMALPTRITFTTNYDNLLELTLLALRRYPERIVARADVPRTGQNPAVAVVKMHGDAQTCQRIVLKRDDYAHFFDTHTDLELLLRGLLLTHTFVFVGYSLRDPNFLHIHEYITRILGKSRPESFVITVDESKKTTDYQEAYWRARNVHLLTMPGATFSERVRESLRLFEWLAHHSWDELSLLLDRHVPLSEPGPLLDAVRTFRAALIASADELALGMTQHIRAPGTDPEVLKLQLGQPLAQTLEFLASQGWSPVGQRWAPEQKPLLDLFELVAALTPSVEERRQLLIQALGHASGFHEVERLKREIDAMTPEGCRP